MKHALTTALFALATVAGCDPLDEGAIGPEGGMVVSLDERVTIDIPEGALDEPIEITIEEVDGLPEGAIGPAYRVLPVGTVFNSPAHVLYNYGARGMEVDPILVVEREHEWAPLADRHVFFDEGVVSASALYLSTFCVIEAESTE
jgi:hypothetical protein